MKKLLNIQKDLKAPKSQYNAFGKYNYRNCEDILEAVKPLCARENVCLTLSDEIVQVGDRYYVRATASLYDCENGELINAVKAYAREEAEKKGMDGSQVTGAASSYARKYALNGLFDIDDTKDADSDEKGAQPAKSGTGAAKAQSAGDKPHREQKPAQSPAEPPKITYEKACGMTFEKGGRKYRLGELSEEWLNKALKNDAYTPLHPYIQVILKQKIMDAAANALNDEDDEDLPFDV